MKKALQTAALLYLAASLFLSALASSGVLRWQIIAHRAPFLLADIAFSQVETIRADGTPEGYDQHGEYIAFSPGLIPGNHAVSIMIYSPFTNHCDDIALRFELPF